MAGIQGTIFELLQYGSLAICIAVIIMEIKAAKVHDHPWGFLWAVPMILWALHGILYYLVLLYCRLVHCDTLTVLLFTKWSTLIRFHGYLTVLTLAIGRYIIGKEVKQRANHS